MLRYNSFGVSDSGKDTFRSLKCQHVHSVGIYFTLKLYLIVVFQHYELTGDCVVFIRYGGNDHAENSAQRYRQIQPD